MHLFLQCIWLLFPLLDCIEFCHGYDSTHEFLMGYLSRHSYDSTVYTAALEYATTHWPQQQRVHIDLMKVRGSMSFHLGKALLFNQYCSSNTKVYSKHKTSFRLYPSTILEYSVYNQLITPIKCLPMYLSGGFRLRKNKSSEWHSGLKFCCVIPVPNHCTPITIAVDSH